MSLIRKPILKFISILEATTILLSISIVSAGCSKKEAISGVKNTIEYVEDDSMWFDYTVTDIKIDFDTTGYRYVNIGTDLTKTDDGFLTYLEAFPATNEANNELYMIKLDNNGNVVSQDLVVPSVLGLEKENQMVVNHTMRKDGQVIYEIFAFYFDNQTGEYSNQIVLYNPISNQIVDLDYLKSKVGSNGEVYMTGFLSGGFEYVIEYLVKDAVPKYLIHLGNNGEFIDTFDVSSNFNEPIWGVTAFEMGNDKLAFELMMETRIEYFYIDKNDYSVSSSESDEYFSREPGFVGSDGKVYSLKYDGIYIEDEVVLPYSCSYVSANKLNSATIIYADGDDFILCGTDYSTGAGVNKIYSFSRSDSNPNVGREIITIGMVGFVDDLTCETISKFNESNDKYFAEAKYYFNDYTSEDLEGSENWTNSDYVKLDLDKSSKLMDELAIDLLSGDGPDIIVNAFSFTQLNNDTYLIDVASFLNDDLDNIELFENVINANKTGDKLYQIPLSFYVSGILADSKNVSGEFGFTFDEYKTYVDEVCNGKNPIRSLGGKTEIYSACLAAMSDELYDENGNVDFTNDAFYEVSEYCKDNIPNDAGFDEDSFITGETEAVGYSISGDSENQVVKFYYILDYLQSLQGNTNMKLYGLPSCDGRGPSIHINSSIAISSMVSNEEAAKEYIKFLLGNDELLSKCFGNPISIEACRNQSITNVESNNLEFDMMLEYNNEHELNTWGYYKYDDSFIEEYINVLKSAETVAVIDPSIRLIVIEEIQPYFIGQKSIEEVAKIIEDRAQTVIDERG